ncbi:MAG: ribose-5-phosphate isomerase RpiA [Alphaproteobacteria bacterium]
MIKSEIAVLKRAAALRALKFVESGMRLGLGTGSTAEIFLELLAARVQEGLRITGAATSQRTASKARTLGIPLAPLEEVAPLDLTIDGADEADRNLDLIKGGGGALLREKIVATASARMVVIADRSKLVPQLGRFPLPIEVIEFGHAVTASRIRAVTAKAGYDSLVMTLRTQDGAVFRSDSGNVIYDCAFNCISAAPDLAALLKGIVGVVEQGLFVGLASELVVAHSPTNVEIIHRRPHG